jgi:hypothetical protein
MVDLLAGVTLTTDSYKAGANCSVTWAPTIDDPANINDGSDATDGGRGSFVKLGPCTYSIAFVADLGADEFVSATRVLCETVGGRIAVEWADAPGGPWTEAAGFTCTVATEDIPQDITFGAEIEARYWRLSHGYTLPGLGPAPPVRISDWQLTEGTGGPPPGPDPDPDGDPVTQQPARAIVEIFVDDPNGAKWGEALWGEDVWPAAGWEPIDDLSLSASVTNGTNRGDQGIVAEPVAGSFTVDTFDPERILDPANEDSPYWGQIVPGLPIRLNHRAVTFRTATLTDATYSLELEGGRLAAADAISEMAKSKVPDDIDLRDTLYTRAIDAIAAAGLSVAIVGPVGDDPALTAYAPGEELTVWEHVKRAAHEVLYVPYIDRNNALGFRAWDSALERGRQLAAPELIDVGSFVTDDGLYSAVRVLDEDGVTVTYRQATPTPRYGLRVYDRRADVPTVDSEAWAERVLADRREQTLRYRPGELRPLTADSVELLGTIEPMEGVDIVVPLTDPPISVHARVVGTRVTVVDETKEPGQVRSRWRFTYTTSASPPVPLTNDDDVTDFLTNEDETDFLYAG